VSNVRPVAYADRRPDVREAAVLPVELVGVITPGVLSAFIPQSAVRGVTIRVKEARG